MRFVGGTTSGAPASGTFRVGDFSIDQSGYMWICTAAGSPGTWINAASGRELAYVEHPASNETTTSDTAEDFATSMSITLGVLPIPVYLRVQAQGSNGTADKGVAVTIVRDSDSAIRTMPGHSSVGGTVGSNNLSLEWRIPANTTAATYKLQKSRTGASGTGTIFATAAKDLFFSCRTA